MKCKSFCMKSIVDADLCTVSHIRSTLHLHHDHAFATKREFLDLLQPWTYTHERKLFKLLHNVWLNYKNTSYINSYLVQGARILMNIIQYWSNTYFKSVRPPFPILLLHIQDWFGEWHHNEHPIVANLEYGASKEVPKICKSNSCELFKTK
jgi:hypothetical protein